MKNIWIDILHIPQFNFYKPFIGLLVEKGYHVYITALGRGKLPAIVRKELAEYKNVVLFHKLLIRFCDSLVRMKIIKITFGV